MILQLLAGNLTHGLLLGGVYGLATMGLSLIFGVMNVVNVGHGAFIMVGAFVALMLFTTLGVSPVLAIPVALLIGMVLATMSVEVKFLKKTNNTIRARVPPMKIFWRTRLMAPRM